MMSKELYRQRIRWEDCSQCVGLSPWRKVWCRGQVNSPDILFVGIGPGEKEEARGLPFVGPAGKLLTRAIREVTGELEFSHAFTNLVLCRPADGRHGNRDPSPEELGACRPRLLTELGVIKPRSAILLGSLVAHWFPRVKFPTRALWHPAYVVRERSKRPEFKERLRLVITELLLEIHGEESWRRR